MPKPSNSAVGVGARFVVPEIDPFLRTPQVTEITGLSRWTINRKVRLREFPAPAQLGTRAVGWRASAVKAWCDGRPDVTPQAA